MTLRPREPRSTERRAYLIGDGTGDDRGHQFGPMPVFYGALLLYFVFFVAMVLHDAIPKYRALVNAGATEPAPAFFHGPSLPLPKEE